MPCELSVNVNAIAYLRNRRDLPWPSVVGLSRVALAAGAHGITVHPRPDERHIRRSDVSDLDKMLRSEFPKAEFNVEGYPDERFMALVAATRPDQVTLVPDDPAQSTSDHGWDFDKNGEWLGTICRQLKALGLRSSVFVDPDPEAPGKARAIGADRVEIYTGPYGGALDPVVAQPEFDRVVACGRAAAKAGVGLNAGHDLTRENLPKLVQALPNLLEVSIGHAITADALTFGMAETVRKFRQAIADH